MKNPAYPNEGDEQLVVSRSNPKMLAMFVTSRTVMSSRSGRFVSRSRRRPAVRLA